MKPKDRRNLYKEQMADRQRENFANKDNSGKFGDIYDLEKKAQVKFWKCKEDDHEIYIVPYIVGSNHPRLKEGKVDFLLDVFVHRKVGINEDEVICLNRTYGEKCPICEYQAMLKDEEEPDKLLIKSLNPTRRNIFNIVCLDSVKEQELGIQVWNVSQWLFTNPLEELAHKKKGGGEVLYADIDDGKIISFRKKGSGVNTTEYTAFEFKDRDEIPDEILDSAICLDELIHKPTYDEVAELFQNKPASSEEEVPEKQEKKVEKEKEKEKEEEKSSGKKLLSKKKDDVPEEKEQDPEETVLECPGGAVLGDDYNEYEECQECVLREQCKKKKEKTAEPEPPPKKKLLTRREK